MPILQVRSKSLRFIESKNPQSCNKKMEKIKTNPSVEIKLHPKTSNLKKNSWNFCCKGVKKNVIQIRIKVVIPIKLPSRSQLKKTQFCSDSLLRKMLRNLYSGVLVILFSIQNQVPQIIIGMGRVIYQIKAISVVIRTTLKNSIFF